MSAGWRVGSDRDINSDAPITASTMDGGVYPPKLAVVQQNTVKSKNLVSSADRKC